MSKKKRDRPPLLFADAFGADVVAHSSEEDVAPDVIEIEEPPAPPDEPDAEVATEPFVPLRDRVFDPLPPVPPPVYRDPVVMPTPRPDVHVDLAQPPPVVASRDRVDELGMHPTALVFLDQPVARKLAVAWNLSLRTMADDEWMSIAGLEHTTEAKRICKALRAHHICRDGGVTDELAMRYITTIVAAPLQKAKAKAATK